MRKSKTRDVTNHETIEAMSYLAAASMKAGAEMGFDKAIQLVEWISDAMGESRAIAEELRNCRERTLANMAREIFDSKGPK